MTHRGPFQPLLFCDSVVALPRRAALGSWVFFVSLTTKSWAMVLWLGWCLSCSQRIPVVPVILVVRCLLRNCLQSLSTLEVPAGTARQLKLVGYTFGYGTMELHSQICTWRGRGS